MLKTPRIYTFLKAIQLLFDDWLWWDLSHGAAPPEDNQSTDLHPTGISTHPFLLSLYDPQGNFKSLDPLVLATFSAWQSYY